MSVFSKTDLATIAGLMIASAGLFFGLRLEGIHIADVGQATAALIVFCGTLGAVLISMPLQQTIEAVQTIPGLFKNFSLQESEVIDRVVRYARIARPRGLLSLEHETESIDDPFFRRAMRLAIDAVGVDVMRNIFDADISGFKAKAEKSALVFDTAAGYAPTLGVAGAAIGLVEVMKHLDHLEQVGMGVASAFVATIYGVLLANLVLLPIATKLRARAEAQARVYSLIAEGILSMVANTNPALIRLRLQALAQMEGEPTVRAGSVRAVSA